MIKLKTVRWKNFLSTGNQFLEVNLDKEPMTLIVGKNGAGKSTLIDAITFSLFGKPFKKINKGQLVNTVNEKNLLTEVEFSLGNSEWKVRRGIKPAIFEIFNNGICVSCNELAFLFVYTMSNAPSHRGCGHVEILGFGLIDFLQFKQTNLYFITK